MQFRIGPYVGFGVTENTQLFPEYLASCCIKWEFEEKSFIQFCYLSIIFESGDEPEDIFFFFDSIGYNSLEWIIIFPCFFFLKLKKNREIV